MDSRCHTAYPDAQDKTHRDNKDIYQCNALQENAVGDIHHQVETYDCRQGKPLSAQLQEGKRYGQTEGHDNIAAPDRDGTRSDGTFTFLGMQPVRSHVPYIIETINGTCRKTIGGKGNQSGIKISPVQQTAVKEQREEDEEVLLATGGDGVITGLISYTF